MYFHPRRSNTAGCLRFKACLILVCGIVSLALVRAAPLHDDCSDKLARRGTGIKWDVDVKLDGGDKEPPEERPETIHRYIDLAIRQQVYPDDEVGSVRVLNPGLPAFIEDEEGDFIKFFITWESRTEPKITRRTTGLVRHIGLQQPNHPTGYVVKLSPPNHLSVHISFQKSSALSKPTPQEEVHKTIEEAIRQNIDEVGEDVLEKVTYRGDVKSHFGISTNCYMKTEGDIRYMREKLEVILNIYAAEHQGSNNTPAIKVTPPSPGNAGQSSFPDRQNRGRN